MSKNKKRRLKTVPTELKYLEEYKINYPKEQRNRETSIKFSNLSRFTSS